MKIDWRTAVAVATAAIIVAGVVIPLEARAPSPNGFMTATSGVAAKRVRVGGAIRPPKKVVHVNPEYPQDARDGKITGVVILEVVIGEDGSVIATKIMRSIPALDQAAIDAVNQWKFEPTLLNGEPVEVEMTVTINFTLQ
jgi:TonB family protein